VPALTWTGARPVDTLSLTYGELADQLGIERETARQLVKRRRWPKWKGNDGQVRFSVPEEMLTVRSESGADPVADRVETGALPDALTGSSPVADRSETGVLPVLERHIGRLEAQLEESNRRAAERDALAAERDILNAQLDALRDATALQLEALRQSTDMQVSALRAALSAAEQDRDRWYKSATTPPELPRPWWRRLVG